MIAGRHKSLFSAKARAPPESGRVKCQHDTTGIKERNDSKDSKKKGAEGHQMGLSYESLCGVLIEVCFKYLSPGFNVFHTSPPLIGWKVVHGLETNFLFQGDETCLRGLAPFGCQTPGSANQARPSHQTQNNVRRQDHPYLSGDATAHFDYLFEPAFCPCDYLADTSLTCISSIR